VFSTFVAFLKLIWPFLKESMLQDGTLRDWVRRQWTSIVWMVFLLTMLLVCFYLADIIRTMRQTNIQKKETIQKRDQEITSLQNTNNDLQQAIQKERESNQRMRRFLLEQCQTNPSVCHFLIDETVVRPNDPPNVTHSQRVNTEWCLLVRGGDLNDEAIRQQFLKECGSMKVADTLKLKP
jgi:cell division protein FtsB